MPEVNFNLKVKEDEEPIDDWSSLCKNPTQFLTEVASRLIASGEFVSESIVISDRLPAAKDRVKLWVKTSWPYALGFLVDGVYRMDYGMTGFTPNTPFLYLKASMDPLPQHVRAYSSSEVSMMGLPKLTKEAQDATVAWYVFEPPVIEY